MYGGIVRHIDYNERIILDKNIVIIVIILNNLLALQHDFYFLTKNFLSLNSKLFYTDTQAYCFVSNISR